MSDRMKRMNQDREIIDCINWLKRRAANYTPEKGKGSVTELVIKHRVVMNLIEEIERYGKDHIFPWQAEYHTCHFCGEYVNQQGYQITGERHYLSDCRPDLVEHEIGETCTWSIYMEGIAEKHDLEPRKIEDTCYAYQDDNRTWTKEHIHFYPDGPM